MTFPLLHSSSRHEFVGEEKRFTEDDSGYESCKLIVGGKLWVNGGLGDLVYLPGSTSLSITLQAQEYEVFTVVPVKRLSTGAAFAPIGLIKMFNSRGAIKDIKYEPERRATVDMKVRGCGIFGSYSSIRPKRVTVDTMDVEFGYEEQSRLITFSLEVPEKELYRWEIIIELKEQ
ncbi:hypothetical protein RJ639_041238 [Escallonia herrerae]|uniref:Uncharacterized protein n=1 Tax=Escallonia herrerae TaxID=1293975 RepID=A0AA88WGD0_9ASTE|nr:hypothetical protein RJ639_041238 [Escallonia herrerae]